MKTGFIWETFFQRTAILSGATPDSFNFKNTAIKFFHRVTSTVRGKRKDADIMEENRKELRDECDRIILV